MDHDAAPGMKRRHWASDRGSDQRSGCGGRERRARARRIASQRYRLLHRRDRYAGLLFSRDGVSGRVRAGRPREAGVRHRDRLQRLHLRLDRRLGLDSLGRLPPHHAHRCGNALEDPRQETIARPRFSSATAPARWFWSAPTRIRSLASDLGADGSRPELLYAQGSGARQPIDHAALDAKVHLIHMQGRETFKLAVQRMVEATDTVLERRRT